MVLVQAQITNNLEANLVELSMGEYVLTIMILMKKNIIWQLNWMLHVWGSPSCEQMDALEQICHAPTKGDLWYPWACQDF